MPEAVTFKVTTYKKLAKGEVGLTLMASRRCAASDVLDWVLQEFPLGSVTVEGVGEDGTVLPPEAVTDLVRMTIDWSKVPGYLRDPVLPARRR